ncbi:DUF7373 family lipoprotein [Nocardia tengchongensis]|uniref:DUF7373 family lipoprotein n=1 Tax=Nocardia tengchongensis TaxID=2055889 RepID=UPI00365CE5CA
MKNNFSRSRSARFRLCAAAAMLVISAPATAGCGSESPATQDRTVDPTSLDTGSYATKPQHVTAADPVAQGRITEALRLGNALPLPSEVDSALADNAHGTHVLLNGYSYEGYITADHFDADTPGFISGFATAAKTKPNTGLYSLDNAVMIFDNEADAANAAVALARTGFALKEAERAEVVALQPTKNPNHRLLWDSKKQLLASWYPVGRFVIFTMVHNSENAYLQIYWNVAAEPAPLVLADKAIDVTTDRLKSFSATPADKIADLPIDPDGMLELTLPRPPGDRTADAFTGTLDQHGALHDADDPNASRARFDTVGVDIVSYGAGQLVRTRDDQAAQTYLETAFADRFHHRIDSPQGLPDASCVKYHGPDLTQFPFVCHVRFGRYVASEWSQQQQDAYQRISAQYAILANKK